MRARGCPSGLSARLFFSALPPAPRRAVAAVSSRFAISKNDWRKIMSNNTYRVRVENADGDARYFTSFVDGAGAVHEIEISREIYLALEDCRKHEKRQAHFVERHVEQTDLSEGQLQERMIRLSPSLELLVENQEQAALLYAAIASLPEIQRRRFQLYHEDGLTYQQIAALEGCTIMPIQRSIVSAEEKIRAKIKLFEK